MTPIPFPQPIPDPADLRLSLDAIVAPAKIQAINQAQKIVFHTVGDTGGIRDGAAQETVIGEVMEADFTSNTGDNPAFPLSSGRRGLLQFCSGRFASAISPAVSIVAGANHRHSRQP